MWDIPHIIGGRYNPTFVAPAVDPLLQPRHPESISADPTDIKFPV